MKPKHERRRFKFPALLRERDVLIDLAEVWHFSSRMKQKGKLSRKVIKKWRSRCNANLKAMHKQIDSCEHIWVPTHLNSGRLSDKLWWRCLLCKTVTSGVDMEDLKESIKSAYGHLVVVREGN